jgi:sodium/hydrogen antiporter
MPSMTGFNTAVAIAAGVVLVLGLFAGYVKNRLWFAEPAICLVTGIVVGPALLGLADFAAWRVDPDLVLLEVCRLTLGIAVMGAALRLPPKYELHNVAAIAVVLGIGLPLMWLTSAALAGVLLGLPVLAALLLGAALAPTDPVIAGSIGSGKVAERCLPGRLRHLLTFESGANDGLGLMFVVLPILLLQHGPSDAMRDWLTRVLLWEVLGAVAVGAAAGWLSGRLLTWALRQPFSESPSTITVGLALSLTVLTLVRLMGSDGILAVFAAGVIFGRYVSRAETRHEHAQEAIGRFFDLPAFVLLGVMLPWSAWAGLGWAGVALALAVLVLRRLPWWLALQPLIGPLETRRDAAFVGWFGPIGVSTVYYALLAQERTGIDQIWPAASLVVFCSVLVHGVSATPITQRFGARSEALQSDRRPGGPPPSG